MYNIDIRSLRVLDGIFKTRSISRTAEQLELTQPAISMTLAKLRDHFQDRLFVRVGHEMTPTAQAEGMRIHVLSAIASLEAVLRYREAFDPRETSRHFRIALSDIGQITIMPRLLAAFRQQAPHAKLEIAELDPSLPDQLAAGSIDLGVGLAPTMPDSFLQRTIYEEDFCVVARRDHPRIRGSLSLALLQSERHVLVLPSVSTQMIIERTLQRQGISRTIELQLPNFLMLAKLVSESDLISIIPGRAGRALERDFDLQILPSPVTIPPYKVRQYWHDRQTGDGAHKWLRELVTQSLAHD